MNSAIENAISDIANRPEEVLRRSIHNCTNILQKQVDKRIKIEADHVTRAESIAVKYAEQRALIAARIEELENRLAGERASLSRINELEQYDLTQEDRRFTSYDAAQRKLIRAAEVMLEELKSP